MHRISNRNVVFHCKVMNELRSFHVASATQERLYCVFQQDWSSEDMLCVEDYTAKKVRFNLVSWGFNFFYFYHLSPYLYHSVSIYLDRRLIIHLFFFDELFVIYLVVNMRECEDRERERKVEIKKERVREREKWIDWSINISELER